MKKVGLLFLALVFVVAIVGCTAKPVTNGDTIQETSELTALQGKITSDGKLIGVAYLGWLEGDLTTTIADLAGLEYTKDMPFVRDITKCAENEGYRMYLVVPADASVTVTVYKCAFDDAYMPYAGEELVSANEPILVRGNISDTIPNLYVVAQKGNEKVEYTTVQSGMDGKLENSKNKVYDFTPYDLLPEFVAYDRVPDAVFCGTWSAIANDGNGEERALNLVIEPDGTAKYSYGIGNSEVLELFEGTWSLENDILKFELVGGVPESFENAVVRMPYDCNPSFAWEMTAEGLSLKHVGGDEIIYGTSGNTFLFNAVEA